MGEIARAVGFMTIVADVDIKVSLVPFAYFVVGQVLTRFRAIYRTRPVCLCRQTSSSVLSWESFSGILWVGAKATLGDFRHQQHLEPIYSFTTWQQWRLAMSTVSSGGSISHTIMSSKTDTPTKTVLRWHATILVFITAEILLSMAANLINLSKPANG